MDLEESDAAIDVLHDDALGLVLWEARGYGPALALTCRRWAGKAKGLRSSHHAMEELARRGHTALLVWIHKLWPYLHINYALVTVVAADEGYWELCEILSDMGGLKEDHKLVSIARGAARIGDLKVLTFALDSLQDKHGKRNNPYYSRLVEQVLLLGASGGHREVCEAARGLGARDSGRMLVAAMQHGHADLCRQARAMHTAEIPKGVWINALEAAVKYDAEHGGDRMCALAKELGARSFDKMLRCAAAQNCERLCLRAREWGGADVCGLLQEAAGAGSESLCRLAVQWGAGALAPSDYNAMLFTAGRRGHAAVCRLAHQWGASDYTGLMASGALGGQVAICRLARELCGGDWEALENDMRGAMVDTFRATSGAMVDTFRATSEECILRLMLEWWGDRPLLLESLASYVVACTPRVDWHWLLREHGVLPDVRAILREFDVLWPTMEIVNRLLAITPGAYDEVLYLGVWLYEVRAIGGIAARFCKLALAKCPRMADWLLSQGAYLGAEPLCHLAVLCGARDFNSMLLGACAGRSKSLIKLARIWGATAAKLSADVVCQVLSE